MDDLLAFGVIGSEFCLLAVCAVVVMFVLFPDLRQEMIEDFRRKP